MANCCQNEHYCQNCICSYVSVHYYKDCLGKLYNQVKKKKKNRLKACPKMRDFLKSIIEIFIL